MENSNYPITISYHDKSSDWLNSREEEIFTDQIIGYDCTLNFDHPEAKTEGVFKTATIAPVDVKTVVLVITGIIGTTILQEFVKDLYGGLKKILKERKKKNTQKSQQFAEIRFAVFFEYRDQGRLNKVALEYKDEETFRISFYRLNEYIKDPKNKKNDRCFELEYPKWGKLYYIFPFGLGPLVIIGMFIIEKYRDYLGYGYRPIIWVFVLPAFFLLATSILIYVWRKRLFRKKYVEKALEWEAKLKSSSSKE